MDFIDKEDISFLEIGQDAGEVTGFLDLRAAGGMDFCPGGGGDDISQRGFPEPGRA